MSANKENGNEPAPKEQDWLKWSCDQCPDHYIDAKGKGRCKRDAPNVLHTKWNGCEARKKEVLATKGEVV